MHGGGVRHLPVVDPNGELVGIVTDRDLRHHLFDPRVLKELGIIAMDTLLNAVRVADVMSSPAVSVRAGDELIEAARLMLEDKVGSLPVVEGGRVVGIITETDLLREICRADQSRSPEVAEIVVSYP
jgi:CBS domain-containing protein